MSLRETRPDGRVSLSAQIREPKLRFETIDDDRSASTVDCLGMVSLLGQCPGLVEKIGSELLESSNAEMHQRRSHAAATRERGWPSVSAATTRISSNSTRDG
jgi:hypothetical protein